MNVYSIQTYAELLEESGLLVRASVPDGAAAIERITYDSRECVPLTLFACKGAAFRPEYLADAISRGAVCYVSQLEYQVEAAALIVTDVRKAMALIADLFYGKAYRRLKLIGITGTKGKSTTAYYIKYILDEYLQSAGERPSAIISTIDVYDGRIMKDSHLTTPEAFELHRHFSNAVESGIRFFEMEVSSQALKYDRVDGVEFDAGVFLNISEDHISPAEHADFEDYFSSKLKLFSQCRLAVVNLDSDYPERILEAAQVCRSVRTFGLYKEADVCGYDVRKVGDEIHFQVRTKEFDEEFALTMQGLFNVENALAAIAVCSQYGIPVEQMRQGLRKARSRGRMEGYRNEDGSILAIVDYAHNKLSFQKVYESIREEYPGRRVITVFGCTGGKALNRRAEMAQLAGKYSDRVYLTMDDPGWEEVHAISQEVEGYLENPACERFLIDDRGEAITAAIRDAEPGSVVLVAGKGHETVQKIRGECVPCKPDSWYVQTALKLRVPAEALGS